MSVPLLPADAVPPRPSTLPFLSGPLTHSQKPLAQTPMSSELNRECDPAGPLGHVGGHLAPGTEVKPPVRPGPLRLPRAQLQELPSVPSPPQCRHLPASPGLEASENRSPPCGLVPRSAPPRPTANRWQEPRSRPWVPLPGPRGLAPVTESSTPPYRPEEDFERQ